jgi:Cysteine-rich secretory protein family
VFSCLELADSSASGLDTGLENSYMIHKHIHKTFKQVFIPHEGNDYRPHFLREHIVLTIVIMSILSLLLSVTSYLVIRKTTYGTLVASAVLIDFTNDTRHELNLPLLVKNELLQLSSLEKAEDMAKFSYFAHNSPDGSTPWKFFKLAKYDYGYAGENLALNFPTSRSVYEGWLNSPKHKDNIVDPKFEEVGISVVSSLYQNKPVLFVVQHFGLPKNKITTPTEIPRYASFFEQLIFSSSYYLEMGYFLLIGITLMAIILMIVIEVEKRHKKHIVYGVLMLLIIILCSLINSELLS